MLWPRRSVVCPNVRLDVHSSVLFILKVHFRKGTFRTSEDLVREREATYYYTHVREDRVHTTPVDFAQAMESRCYFTWVAS